jgi:sulfhydrogenase subunit beta (sulfur reductase)
VNFLSNEKAKTWIQQLIGKKTVIGPKFHQNQVHFLPIQSLDEVTFDYINAVLSPKQYFFPKTEALFSAQIQKDEIKIEPTQLTQETVIFGIRPCDAKALVLLDGPFLEAPGDEMWKQHRDRTTLIGLSCLKTGPQCFCTSMNSAPDDSSSVDILLTQTEKGYWVEVVTDKGKKLLEGIELEPFQGSKPNPPLLTPRFKPQEIPGLFQKSFTSRYWSELSDRCIQCRICSYMCPTCYCFEVRDRTVCNEVCRLRSWESCQPRGFTKMAGGHDPRLDRGNRMRQRFAHKLSYFPGQFKFIGCVGCGRCVVACPVNIDIREVVEDIVKEGKKK